MNPHSVYDIDEHVAELYDRQITETHDIEFLLRQIAGRGPWKILEPFCGTGRILLPLAEHGHTLTGLDSSAGLLARARQKAESLPAEVCARVTLLEMDVTTRAWPGGNDLVILGGNCFYELPEAVIQEGCIRTALDALRPGGCLFIDNNHLEGDLPPAWQDPAPQPAFPSGTCADGTRLESTMQTVAFDAPRRLACFRRVTRVTHPSGQTEVKVRMQQKHPVSMAEVRDWLEYHTFTIKAMWGDYDGSPYTPDSPRAIFWARRP